MSIFYEIEFAKYILPYHFLRYNEGDCFLGWGGMYGT